MIASRRGLTSIPGWFARPDVLLFDWFLEEQLLRGVHGDLAELGAYAGKSAAVIGFHVAETETFTVVDLFEDLPQGGGARTENDELYARLSQRAFDSNYGRFHTRMPVVVRAPTSEVLSHAHARAQLRARGCLKPLRRCARGCARHACAHGTGCNCRVRRLPVPTHARYRSTSVGGDHHCVQPIVVSDNMLYATWRDAAAWQETLLRWAPTAGLRVEVQAVLGRPLVRVWAGAGMTPAWLGYTPPRLVQLLKHLRDVRGTAWTRGKDRA